VLGAVKLAQKLPPVDLIKMGQTHGAACLAGSCLKEPHLVGYGHDNIIICAQGGAHDCRRSATAGLGTGRLDALRGTSSFGCSRSTV
jgi:hypothetical protein